MLLLIRAKIVEQWNFQAEVDFRDLLIQPPYWRGVETGLKGRKGPGSDIQIYRQCWNPGSVQPTLYRVHEI